MSAPSKQEYVVHLNDVPQLSCDAANPRRVYSKTPRYLGLAKTLLQQFNSSCILFPSNSFLARLVACRYASNAAPLLEYGVRHAARFCNSSNRDAASNLCEQLVFQLVSVLGLQRQTGFASPRGQNLVVYSAVPGYSRYRRAVSHSLNLLLLELGRVLAS